MTNKGDPYFDKRTYHKAALMNEAGGVSPLCAKKPYSLNLKKHQLWTTRWEAVTCKRCLALKPAIQEDLLRPRSSTG